MEGGRVCDNPTSERIGRSEETRGGNDVVVKREGKEC